MPRPDPPAALVEALEALDYCTDYAPDAAWNQARDRFVELAIPFVRVAVSTPAPPPSELQLRYDELLYAVAMKYPGESRHQTALRYIRQAERQSHQAALAVTERTPLADSAEMLSLGRRQEDGPRDT